MSQMNVNSRTTFTEIATTFQATGKGSDDHHIRFDNAKTLYTSKDASIAGPAKTLGGVVSTVTFGSVKQLEKYGSDRLEQRASKQSEGATYIKQAIDREFGFGVADRVFANIQQKNQHVNLNQGVTPGDLAAIKKEITNVTQQDIVFFNTATPQQHFDAALDILAQFRKMKDPPSDLAIKFQDHVRKADQGGDKEVHKQLMLLVKTCALNEGTDVHDSNLLFRANTDRALVLRAGNFSHIPDSLECGLKNAIERADDHHKLLQCDPSKINKADIPFGSTAEEVAKENAQLMITDFNKFLSDIGVGGLGTMNRVVTSLPQEMCDCMRATYDGIKASPHGDAEALKQVGANLFLRMINPMLITPGGSPPTQPHELSSEKLNPDTQKNLVLLTKIVQNLANGVDFGEKEKHMTVFNDALHAHHDGMEMFTKLVISRGRPTSELG